MGKKTLDGMMEEGFSLLSEATREEYAQLRERESQVVRILEGIPDPESPSCAENVLDVLETPDTDPDGKLSEERIRIKERLLAIQDEAWAAYEEKHGPVVR